MYGRDFWFHVVIALTKADRYEAHKWLSKPAVYPLNFEKDLQNYRRVLKKKFTATADQVEPSCHIGMTETEFDQIPIVPTSELNKISMDRMNQVGWGYWFDVLLIKCSQTILGSRLQIHRDRLSKLPPEILQQELGEDMHKEILSKRSRLITNYFRWQSYCTSVKTMPRFEMNDM